MPLLLVGLLALGALAYWESTRGSSSPPPPSPTPAIPTVVPSAATGTTMSVALTTPAGNLGVAALPSGATLILGGAAVASITSVQFLTPGLVTLAAQTATAVAMQATGALVGQSSGAVASIQWVDLATGQPQTSTLQIVAESQGTVISLQPGQMSNVILPLSSSSVTGEMLFVPPAKQATDAALPVITGGSLSSGSLSVNGTFYPAAVGTPGGSYGVQAAAGGTSTLTIAWTDGTGASQQSVVNVIVLPN